MNAQINPGWKPPLATSPLRGRVAVIFLSRPFAAPYASTRPAPSPASSARALAARLRGTGVSVVQLTVRPTRTSDPTSGDHQVGPPLPNLLELADPGDTNGEPFDSVGCGARLEQSPTVFVVGRDEIVHAVFEGQSAGSIPAIEAAARRAAGGSSP